MGIGLREFERVPIAALICFTLFMPDSLLAEDFVELMDVAPSLALAWDSSQAGIMNFYRVVFLYEN
jgi:hypothetical protein